LNIIYAYNNYLNIFLYKGCLFYEDTDLVDSISILKNIEIRNLWKDHPNNGLGSIIK